MSMLFTVHLWFLGANKRLPPRPEVLKAIWEGTQIYPFYCSDHIIQEVQLSINYIVHRLQLDHARSTNERASEFGPPKASPIRFEEASCFSPFTKKTHGLRLGLTHNLSLTAEQYECD